MKINCPNCKASFNVDDITVFNQDTNYVKCCKCYYIWDITNFVKQHNRKYKSISGHKHASASAGFFDLNNITMLVGLLLCILVIFFDCLHQKIHSTHLSEVVIKDARCMMSADNITIKYHLLNLSKDSIKVNRINILFWINNKVIYRFMKYDHAILLKPYQRYNIVHQGYDMQHPQLLQDNNLRVTVKLY